MYALQTGVQYQVGFLSNQCRMIGPDLFRPDMNRIRLFQKFPIEFETLRAGHKPT